MLMTLVAAAADSAFGGQVVILVGAIATVIAAMGTLVMLGPNRRSKAMEIAEKGIDIAEKRAINAEHDEAEIRGELVLLEARVEALTRKNNQLRARLREAGLDDT